MTAAPGAPDWPTTADTDDDRAEPSHQPRERPVPCAGCGRSTWNYHAVCADCHVELIADGKCGRCAQDRDCTTWPETQR